MSVTPDPSPLSRRSFSLPIARNSPPSDPQIEVLYTLNSSRIISFNTPNTSSRSTPSSEHLLENEEVGKLSWTTRFETTLAVGPLRIYRAPGSVAFLHCANALRPILPKSQAWCVDGDSKFVLQIRRPQYWRIEVSNKTAEEKAKVEEMKQVLGEVLLFEKTPCPFQRDFVVELPAVPTTPVTKRPWKPVQGPRPQTPLSPESSVDYGYTAAPLGRRASSASPLRQPPLANGRRKSEIDLSFRAETAQTDSDPNTSSREGSTAIQETEEFIEPNKIANANSKTELEDGGVLLRKPEEELFGLRKSPSSESLTHDDSDAFSEATDDTGSTSKPRGRPNSPLQYLLEPETTSEKLDSSRISTNNISKPSTLSITTNLSSPVGGHVAATDETSDDEGFSSSVESFHTVQSWHSLSPTDSEPSPPLGAISLPDGNLLVSKRPHHLREVSELTITPHVPHAWDMSKTPDLELDDRSVLSPEPKTPTLTHDGSERSEDEHFEIVTPPTARQGLRHRATTSSNSRRRQLSPLPAAANLFSPGRTRPRNSQSGRHLPTAIIQKTYEILLSPPSHLFNLMLNIASRIVAGEWRGAFLGHDEPVHWDFEDEYSREPTEDDYGVCLNQTAKIDKSPSNSWEVD